MGEGFGDWRDRHPERLRAGPLPRRGHVDGFRVGRYERRPLRGDPNYARPAGFVEVTEANQGTLVAPHFTLGQFVSKQTGGFPKYLVLRERLLLKLEMLLEEVRTAGCRRRRCGS